MESRELAEHFVRAVDALATGRGTIQERLSAAWIELMPVARHDLPAELQEYFAVVESENLGSPDDPNAIDEETAVSAAKRVYQLALMVWANT